MKKLFKSSTSIPKAMLLSCFILLSSCSVINNSSFPTTVKKEYMRDYYRDYFDIGAAILPYSIDNHQYDDLLGHYSTLTCENDMKWGRLEPSKGNFTYEGADKVVSYAKTHDKRVRGHTLIWHKSLPTWVKEECSSKEKALEIIDTHIKETMAHFGNDVYCYDVVNEALHSSINENALITDDLYRTGEAEISGSSTMDFYQLCGFDYIKQAFIAANQAKELYDLDVDLFYNDYSLNNPYKRQAAIKMIRQLQKADIAIDGIGMQAHYRLDDYLSNKDYFLNNFEESIRAFTALGIDVHITELDICVYKQNDLPSQFDSLPLDIEEKQAEMYGKIFEICRKYSLPYQSGAGIISNVTTWGIADDHNAWNTSAHKEFPLVFHKDHSKKLAFDSIVNFTKEY